MNALSIAQPTMSSREIAELVESRHDNVMRTIERLADRGVLILPPLEEVSNDGPGPKTFTAYRVGKRDSYIIVAQLSPEFTARLVDRWQQLEAGAAPRLPGTFAEALRLAAEQAEQLERQAEALAIAAPKADALDRIATAEGSLCITDAVKALQVRRMDLSRLMQAKGWIYRRQGCADWLGYQDKVSVGYLEHKVTTVQRDDGSEKIVQQVRVTPKGLARLAKEFS